MTPCPSSKALIICTSLESLPLITYLMTQISLFRLQYTLATLLISSLSTWKYKLMEESLGSRPCPLVSLTSLQSGTWALDQTIHAAWVKSFWPLMTSLSLPLLTQCIYLTSMSLQNNAASHLHLWFLLQLQSCLSKQPSTTKWLLFLSISTSLNAVVSKNASRNIFKAHLTSSSTQYTHHQKVHHDWAQPLGSLSDFSTKNHWWSQHAISPTPTNHKESMVSGPITATTLSTSTITPVDQSTSMELGVWLINCLPTHKRTAYSCPAGQV